MSSNRRNRTAALAFSVVLAAGHSTAAEDHAPLPEKLVTAKAAYLVNESRDLKAFDKFYQEVKKWNRFNIVSSRNEADIVMVLTTVSGVTTGIEAAEQMPALQLEILDTATSEVLWGDVTDKWLTSGHAPSKLVSNLKKRMPKR